MQEMLICTKALDWNAPNVKLVHPMSACSFVHDPTEYVKRLFKLLHFTSCCCVCTSVATQQEYNLSGPFLVLSAQYCWNLTESGIKPHLLTHNADKRKSWTIFKEMFKSFPQDNERLTWDVIWMWLYREHTTVDCRDSWATGGRRVFPLQAGAYMCICIIHGWCCKYWHDN